MPSQTAPSASASVEINADADAVYALITDLPTLAGLAEENVAMQWRKGGAATPGAVFRGHNRNGVRRWSTTCTVTDAEPGRRFAFDVRSMVMPVARWAYEIEPTAGGVRVTESTWDRRPRWAVGFTTLVTGVADRATTNGDHIRATLQRLKERAERAA